MEQYNRIELRGIVGSARVTRQGDKDLLQASVATSRAFRDSVRNAVIETTWHNVTCLGPIDSFIGIEKRTKVYICGRILNRQYTNADGTASYRYEVVATKLEVLDDNLPLEGEFDAGTDCVREKKEEEKYESLTEYCRNWIKDHICDYIGQEEYACDLGYKLTEGPNCDGSCTYSTYKAKMYLKEWWEDAADYWQYEKDNFGENSHNPFENPEAYMVCMLIEGVNCLINQVKCIDEQWNDCIEITDELVAKIVAEIDQYEVKF